SGWINSTYIRSLPFIQLLDVHELCTLIFIGINILSRLDAVNGPKGIFLWFIYLCCRVFDAKASDPTVSTMRTIGNKNGKMHMDLYAVKI
ncbi:hypothetical protein ACJX0J_013510, partial [Zea mays]